MFNYLKKAIEWYCEECSHVYDAESDDSMKM